MIYNIEQSSDDLIVTITELLVTCINKGLQKQQTTWNSISRDNNRFVLNFLTDLKVCFYQ